jgi:hypothetical protein
MSGQPGTQQQDTITEEDMQACLDDEDRQAAERREDKDDQAEHQQAETFTCPVSGCSFQGNGNSSDTKRRSVAAHLKAKGDTQHQEYRERIAGDPQQDGVTDKAFDTFVKQLPQQVQGAAEKLRALVREITKKKRDLQTARDQLYQIENSGIRGRPTAEVAAQKATLHSQISRLSDELRGQTVIEPPVLLTEQQAASELETNPGAARSAASGRSTQPRIDGAVAENSDSEDEDVDRALESRRRGAHGGRVAGAGNDDGGLLDDEEDLVDEDGVPIAGVPCEGEAAACK